MDSKIEKERNNYRIGFIVTIVLLGLIIVGLVVVISLGISYYYYYKNGLYGGFFNDNICKVEPKYCNYLDLNVAIPSNYPLEGFDQSVALLNSQLCANIGYYSRIGNVLNLPTGLTFLEFLPGCPACSLPIGLKQKDFEAPFASFILDEVNRVLFISWRGAITSQDYAFSFWFSQQNLTLSKLKDIIVPDPTKAIDLIPVCNEAQVETGFSVIWTGLQEAFQIILEKYLDRCDKIMISGHSLGGALASLSAVFCCSFPKSATKNIQCYTFGKPRVGNQVYASCVEILLPNRFFRIENLTDVVPQVPLGQSPNFDHPDDPYLYVHEGTLLYFQKNLGSSWDHSIMIFQIWLKYHYPKLWWAD